MFRAVRNVVTTQKYFSLFNQQLVYISSTSPIYKRHGGNSSQVQKIKRVYGGSRKVQPKANHHKPSDVVLAKGRKKITDEIENIKSDQNFLSDIESITKNLTGPHFESDYTFYSPTKYAAEDHLLLMQELDQGIKAKNIDNYVHLFRVLSAKGLGRQMEDILDDLSHQSSELARHEPLYASTIAGYAQAKDASNAIRMLGRTKQLGINLSEWCHYFAIQACARANKLDLANSLLQRMNNDGITPGAPAYVILMHGLISKGKVDEAWDLFHLVRQNVLDPNIYMFTTLMDGYARIGRYERVINLYDDLRAQGLQPSAVTYNCIIKACSNSAYYSPKAFLWFERMKSEGYFPDEYTFKSLLHSCSQFGDIEKAYEVLLDMEKHEYPIEETSYNILFNILARSNIKFLYSGSTHRRPPPPQLPRPRYLQGDIKTVTSGDHAVEWEVEDCDDLSEEEFTAEEIKELKNEDCDQDEAESISVCDSNPNALAKPQESWVDSQNRRMDQADALLEDMIKQGISPSLITLNSWMNVAASARRVSRALRCVERYKEFGVEPDKFTYRALVRMYARGKHVDRVEDIMQRIRNENIERDSKTYGYVVDLKARTQDLPGAMRVLEEMHKHNISIDEKYLKHLRKLADKKQFTSELIPKDPDAWLKQKVNRPYRKRK